MTVKIGEMQKAFYRAKNNSKQSITGMAVFNVTPHIAGEYFKKIDCFCFEEQTLEPGESADMPVTFFIDSSILENSETKNINVITLSYTFFNNPPD
jgi:cytochrome c oxidase assembly protein subunit 11